MERRNREGGQAIGGGEETQETDEAGVTHQVVDLLWVVTECHLDWADVDSMGAGWRMAGGRPTSGHYAARFSTSAAIRSFGSRLSSSADREWGSVRPFATFSEEPICGASRAAGHRRPSAGPKRHHRMIRYALSCMLVKDSCNAKGYIMH